MKLYNSKRVLCVETGEIFESISDASKLYGIKGIQRAIHSASNNAGGKRWVEVPKGLEGNDLAFWADGKKSSRFISKSELISKSKDKFKRRVFCVDTREIFQTAHEASKAHPNASPEKIRSSCTGSRLSAGGKIWKYIPNGIEGERLHSWIKEELGKDRPQIGCSASNKAKTRKYAILDCGLVFASGIDCALHLGVNAASVTKAARRLGNVNGIAIRKIPASITCDKFDEFIEKCIKEIDNRTSNHFYVYVHRRLDNGEIFYVGKGSGKRKDQKKGRSSVWQSMERDAGGHWSEIVFQNLTSSSALEKEIELIKKLSFEGLSLANQSSGGEGGGNGVGSRVLCIETGVIYNTMIEASSSLGISNISSAARGKLLSAGGYTWKKVPYELTDDKLSYWIADQLMMERKPFGRAAAELSKLKPCFVVETGNVYLSQKECAKSLGICYSKIGDVINGKRKSVGGYRVASIPKSLPKDQWSAFVESTISDIKSTSATQSSAEREV